MTAPQITALPTAPAVTDGDAFSGRMFAWTQHFTETTVSEVNAVKNYLNALSALNGSTSPHSLTRAAAISGNTEGQQVIFAEGLFYQRDDAATTPALALTSGDGYKYIPLGTVCPGHYGWLRDGSASATAAVKQAWDYVASLGGGIVQAQNFGKMRIDTPTILEDGHDVTLDLRAAVLDATNFAHVAADDASGAAWGAKGAGRYRAAFEFHGELIRTTTLSATVAQDASTFSVTSATDVQAGDLAHINAPTLEYPGAVGRFQIVRVKSISGTTITIDHRFATAFDDITDDVEVRFFRPLRNARFVLGNLTGPGRTETLDNGFGPCGVLVQGFEDFELFFDSISGFQNRQAGCAYGDGIKVFGNTMKGIAVDGTWPADSSKHGFYGWWSSECVNVTVENITGYRLSHVIDGARTRHKLVKNCVGVDCIRSTFTCHSGDDWVYDECDDRGGGGAGILWRGADVTVTGCNMTGLSASSGYAFYVDSAATCSFGANVKIKDNKFRTGRGVLLKQDRFESVEIVNNEMVAGINANSDTPLIFEVDSIKRLVIRDNDMETITNDSCIDAHVGFTNVGFTDGDFIEIIGNKFRGHTESPVQFRSLPTGVHLRVRDNTSFGSNAAPIVDCPDSTTAIRDIQNNYDLSGPVDNVMTATPSITFSVASTGITYSETPTTRFWIVGNILHFIVDISLSSKGTASGTLEVRTGIPARYNAAYDSTFAPRVNNYDFAKATNGFVAYARQGTTNIWITSPADSAGVGVMSRLIASDFKDDTTLILTGSWPLI